MTTESPLGRYVQEPAGSSPDLATVRLLGVPVRVLAAAREHHDNLMREFRLMALSGGLDDGAAPTRLAALTQVLGVRYAGSSDRPDAEVDAALDRGDVTVDLDYEVPPEVAQAARQLDELMREADEFCRSEQLLTLERGEVVREFAAWYLDEFVRQCAGGEPRRWDGPLDPD